MSNILIVPGLHNSGPCHWQSLWHQQFPHWLRVTGQTWERAELASWSQRVANLLAASQDPLHIVAHSFGSLASIAAAARHPDKVASLFLVAPADPANFAIADRDLPPPPLVPGLLVASQNDPWMSLERARYWSERWQLPLHDAGAAGHINAESGHGHWAPGQQLLAELLQQYHFADPHPASARRAG
jgi:uncharacterized protein